MRTFFLTLMSIVLFSAVAIAQTTVMLSTSDELSPTRPSVDVTFEGEQGQMVDIAVTSDGFDTYIRLLDEAGVELSYSDDDYYAGETNSRIRAFRLPYTGAYTLSVTSSGYYYYEDETASGLFNVQVSSVEAITLLVDQPRKVVMTAGETYAFVFEAVYGGFYDIAVENGTVQIGVYDPDGYDALYDTYPTVEQFQSFYDGEYTIIVEPDSDIATAVIQVSTSVLPTLNLGSNTISFDGEMFEKLYVMQVEEGITYQISVIPSIKQGFDFSMDISDNSTAGYVTIGSLSVSNFTMAEASFTSSISGEVPVRVQSYYWEPSQVKLTIEAQVE